MQRILNWRLNTEHDRQPGKFIVLLGFLTLCIASGCSNNSAPTWYKYYLDLGTYSSPRMADLNKDGILDIVIGAGGKEDAASDSAVIAVDGANGKLLWKISGVNQYTGCALFKDITDDGIPDVFIGGRWAQFSAIDGSDGTLLWSFLPDRSTPSAADSGWYNFSTPQFVPDQDGDGVDDLLVANGGNSLAAANDTNRPAGKILVLSAATGHILSSVEVPDGRETYMSVLCYPSSNPGDPYVLFGTGGETIGGHLYRTRLTNIMKGNIAEADILASSSTKGFIAPPVLINLNDDGIADIVFSKVDGTLVALDGKSDSILWQHFFPGTEAYTMPAIGDFNGDSIPDLFCNFAIGTFPKLERSIRFMVNGRTGTIEYQDTIRSFQYASGIAADINNDGIDDVLINQSELRRKQFTDEYFSCLLVFDFRNKNIYPLGDTLPATNLASTPWIGDMDDDGELDIIYSAVKYDDIRFDLQKPQGLLLGHYCTGIRFRNRPVWGAYMGSSYTSEYLPSMHRSK